MFDYKGRVMTLSHELEAVGADACIVSSMPNMRYYSGFTGDSGVLLVKGDERYLFTDSRYREQAMQQAPDYVYNEFANRSEMWKAVKTVLDQKGWNTLGFEDETILYTDYLAMTEQLPATWRGMSAAMNRQRAFKDEEEQRRMWRAGEISDEAFTHMLSFIRPGISEIDIAIELEFYMRKHGAEANAFDPIIASGENGSKPHAVPSQRLVQTGELITMDFGALYEGYCADMTRTVALGDLAEKAVSVYNIVHKAQLTVCENLQAGMTGREVDAIARDIITDAGYGNCFGHGLGHSLGIEIHENPRFSRTDDTVIEAGMMMTVEPGIYIDGEFGVRIEDFGLITDQGYKAFSHSNKELIYI